MYVSDVNEIQDYLKEQNVDYTMPDIPQDSWAATTFLHVILTKQRLTGSRRGYQQNVLSVFFHSSQDFFCCLAGAFLIAKKCQTLGTKL